MNAPIFDPTTTIIEQRGAFVSPPPGAEPVPTSAEGARYSVFTLDHKRAFLRNLQLFGNVRHATRAACVSAQTAYRARRQSAQFRLMWDAALLAARAQVLAAPALQGALPMPAEGAIAEILARHLPLTAEHKARILAERARGDALYRGAPAELAGLIGLISLFLSYRFYDDPFHAGPAAGERDWHGLCAAAWQQITERRNGDRDGN